MTDSLPGWREIYESAREVAGRESWEPVEEDALREALEEIGRDEWLDYGTIASTDAWKRYDLSEDGEEPDVRWYYSTGDEPRPDEFRRFHQLITAEAPEAYSPYYFRVEPAGKAPATRYGSWKDETARLDVEGAVEWMESGGNVGLAGTPDGPLVNFDIDDGEETTPADLPETLRAKSRSRGRSFHAWGFNPEGDVPNLPTDDLGEVRTNWQYVVAPGSFVASAAEEIPEDADSPGYYTVEHEAPVATVTYDDLPEAFREWEEKKEAEEDTPPEDVDDVTASESVNIGSASGRSGGSAVFDVRAEDLADSRDPSDRWSSMFHGSKTDANMSISNKGRLQCWRHNVAHGGLQALAALSSLSPAHACREIGKGHDLSNAGACRYKGDWRLVWWAWEYAKSTGHIPEDDPVPYRVLVNLAVRDGLVERDDLVEREGDEGGSYTALPDAEAYNDALEHVREEYGREPGRDPVDGGGRDLSPVSALPLEQLGALDPDQRREAVERRGVDIPDTDEVRDRVAQAIDGVLESGETAVVEAPTGAGKSYYTSTTPWRSRGVAGDQPVIEFADTREHREQNAQKSSQAGVRYLQLRGRKEACPCAAGDHDPKAAAEADEDRQAVTVDGVPISKWFDRQCEGKHIPFSLNHRYAAENNDQGVELPCGGEDCQAITQWDDVPRGDDGSPTADVIHATDKFALVPSLRMSTNMAFDERPDFTIDIGDGGELSHDRIHRMIAAYLDEIGALVTTWEAFVGLAKADYDTDAGAEAEVLADTLEEAEPRREWYFEDPDAHTLAPALARAVWYALRSRPDKNGRRSATVTHEPPRLDANANTDEGWNRNWVQVVLDEQNRITKLWQAPDLSQARSVVGLDARPAMERWKLNVHPDIRRVPVLDTEERALWRFFEQRKTVVQVGDATRPFTSGKYFDDDGTEAVVESLVDQHGDLAVITAGSVEHEHREILERYGVDEPKTMHYGEEKSREDFGDEDALLVNGVIDPGDDMVLDLLAALDKDAQPETTETDDGVERAHGRGFTGPDAGAAESLLESVRANHVAQAIGRSARNPDSDTRSVVYVRTDVAPPDLVDLQVPGVQWVYGDKQRRVVEYLRDNPGCTAKEIADETGTSKEHVRETLERLRDRGRLVAREGAGEYGATVWRTAADGPAEVGEVEIGRSAVWCSYTLRLPITSPHIRGEAASTETGLAPAGPNERLTAFGAGPPG